MVLKELCALRGVSGDEKRVRDYILERVKPFATETKIDRAGNLIAFRRGTGENRRHVALVAHMDEVGMIALGAMDNGLIRYSPVGGIDPRVVVSKPVRIGDKEVPGVIGAKAIHLQTADERNHVLDHDELAIDVGAKDKKDAEKLVSPGDLISFESKWVEFGDGMVKARAMDDRIGCAVAMSISRGRLPVRRDVRIYGQRRNRSDWRSGGRVQRSSGRGADSGSNGRERSRLRGRAS